MTNKEYQTEADRVFEPKPQELGMDALRQENARREAAMDNCKRLRELRLSQQKSDSK
jgi:hypothetical protein